MRADTLAGAALFILDDDVVKSNKEGHQDVITYIRTLGGRIVMELCDATHAALVDEPESLSSQLETAIVTAQASSIPIVLARAWLKQCAQLSSGDHWSDIPVVDLIPSVVRKLHDSCTVSTRRDERESLSQSISQTFNYLKREDPDLLEQNALKRAMELSMLDCAIVLSSNDVTTRGEGPQSGECSRKVLGVDANATPQQIKSAYRKLARVCHPDKGGSEEAFQKVALAYRTLLVSLPSIVITDKIGKPKHLKTTAHWDSELADHRRLVEELFAAHGADLEHTAATQQSVLQSLKIERKSAGSTNVNEQEELIHNSCFYLSLAASYLGGIGALLLDDDKKKDNYDLCSTSVFGEEDRFLIGETALQLKRRIEAAVVTAHPEWAESGMVGEEVQAFSDFLVYLLDCPQAVVSDWAVVVFDTTSGMCDIYKGKYYDSKPHGHASNCITISYTPGHYEPLLPIFPEERPTLQQILDLLDANGVLYVVTDGAG